ncbi:gliding motility-associated C-terminal domain-containing protein [Rubrolithibacter danxiaensis]|uniref:gliding motility-associated C-terminal domain-containing protein n=1 Tax=Rubrolithibacter danxiaensis TaxID=3390805 RepID=UPI003BF86552
MQRIILIALFFCIYKPGFAQLVNSGQAISVNSNGLLYIGGDFVNNEGTILNKGTIIQKGNWTNDDATSFVFDEKSTGTVKFFGNDQLISGISKTVFYDVAFSGTGQKILDSDIDVTRKLDLTDRELQVGDFIVSVSNPDAGAIIRTKGFISTGERGRLIRNTNSQASYLFPLGSSANGDLFYRPVMIEPGNALQNSFSVGLIYSDPALIGYDRESKRQDIQNISDKYFYLLSQTDGTANSNIKFYRNSNSDGNFSQLVSWNKFKLWEKAAPSTNADGDFGDGLNRALIFSSIETFRNLPIGFANLAATNSDFAPGPLTFFNAFSPDGDGKNDTWIIKNIDLYPDNNLTIMNRWGDPVFKCKGYSGSKAWDGGSVLPGTYFYLLDVVINGKKQVYKGFITMVKKD